ncbi:MAG: hypothetical protein K5978_01815 [Campylobacter sp.]|nr:hypothetical protein [Campylobacter sp.]
MKAKLVSRIAPTPSGFLHVGNAFNFLLTYLYTKSNDGFLYLRIDDYDSSRYRREYVQNIFDVLEFLGICYDSGAKSVMDFEENFSFKKRFALYKNALEKLDEIYVCQCSRNTPNAYKNGIYQGLCKNKNLKFEKDKNAIRLKTSGLSLGDFIIWKKDDSPSYNFASVVDDEQMGVNFVLRGEDLLECSKAQIYLAKMLNFNFAKAKIFHHELLCQNGVKLSKSQKAVGVDVKSKAQNYYKIVANKLNLNPKSAENLQNLLYEFKLCQSQGGVDFFKI